LFHLSLFVSLALAVESNSLMQHACTRLTTETGTLIRDLPPNKADLQFAKK